MVSDYVLRRQQGIDKAPVLSALPSRGGGTVSTVPDAAWWVTS